MVWISVMLQTEGPAMRDAAYQRLVAAGKIDPVTGFLKKEEPADPNTSLRGGEVLESSAETGEKAMRAATPSEMAMDADSSLGE